MGGIDIERLQTASLQLSDVIVDPARWTDLLEKIEIAVGATGAAIVPHEGIEGSVASPSGKDCLATYVREGWCDGDRDTRKHAIRLQLRGKVVIDRDLVTDDEMRRSAFFNEFLPRFGGRWWAGVGFRSGSEGWCMALHRTARAGQFQQTERAILQQFSSRLNEIGKLSQVIGHTTLSNIAGSFDQIGEAVVAIDETGGVIRANATADNLFCDEARVVRGRMLLGDRNAAVEYQRLLDRIRWAPEGKPLRAAPIIVRRKNAAPLTIEVLPLDGAAKSPFLHARALLLLRGSGQPTEYNWQILSGAFGLTPAEARLAARLANGESLKSAADALRITKETARSRLKSIFQKTDVHRQGELVSLLASLLHNNTWFWGRAVAKTMPNRRGTISS